MYKLILNNLKIVAKLLFSSVECSHCFHATYAETFYNNQIKLLNYIYIYGTIGLSGKFVPMLKENWNAENLNFSIHLLNYIG